MHPLCAMANCSFVNGSWIGYEQGTQGGLPRHVMYAVIGGSAAAGLCLLCLCLRICCGEAATGCCICCSSCDGRCCCNEPEPMAPSRPGHGTSTTTARPPPRPWVPPDRPVQPPLDLIALPMIAPMDAARFADIGYGDAYTPRGSVPAHLEDTKQTV